VAKHKERALGKGLNSLLPADFVSEDQGIDISVKPKIDDSPYFLCPIDFIEANPYQPRSEMEEAPLRQLASSIKEKGILQPLVVREVAANRYELIAGERRLRAAKIAGLEKVPVLKKDIAIVDRLELALIENIQRENLNAVEEARAYSRLMEEFDLTQEAVALRVGKNRSTIANSIRILQLPEDVLDDLARGKISAGHARVLLGLNSLEEMRALRDAIIAKKLSVRETEAILKEQRKKEGSSKKKGGEKKRHALSESFCKSLTNTLTNFLGSQARIVQNGDRGKIEIEYYSVDDLERVLAVIHKE